MNFRIQKFPAGGKKQNFVLAVCYALILTVLSSCAKQENPLAEPVISQVEIGASHSKQVNAGEELHIDALIRAEAAIDRIVVEIHPEGGGFSIDKVFVEDIYRGKRQVHFHEHLQIPANTAAGAYHFHLWVEDSHGRVARFDTEIEILN